MTNLNFAIKLIEEHYPQNIKYEDPEYKQSQEYLSLINKKKFYIENNIDKKIKIELERVFKEYEVVNWTDLNMYNSFEFHILLHKNQKILDDDIDLIKSLNNKRVDLHLFISALGDYYFYFINISTFDEKDNKWDFEKIFDPIDEYQITVTVLEKILKKLGYIKVSYAEATSKIKNIDLECINKDDVTVFNCLFSDIVKI